jgi:drug/metabolite transporter (DMT)-like permease
MAATSATACLEMDLGSSMGTAVIIVATSHLPQRDRSRLQVGSASNVRASRSVPLALAGLLIVCMWWGATFVVVKDAVERMPVMDFLAVRFLIAAAVMVAIRPRVMPAISRSLGSWRTGLSAHGTLLGLALGLGYVGQTFGLQHTSATISGFITGMFVVFTPLIAAVLLRRPVGTSAWVGVLLATTGLAVISLHGFSIGLGEGLTLLCAALFALHIVGLGEWSPRYDSYALAVVQLTTVGVLCAIAAAPGGLTAPPDRAAWGAVLITALFATAFAFVVQTWAQTVLSPTRTAVVMTMEPVFAGLFGVLVGGDNLTARIVLGGTLVVAAMYIVELGPRHSVDARVGRLET